MAERLVPFCGRIGFSRQEAAHTMCALGDFSIGERIAFDCNRRGYTEEVLANLAGSERLHRS
ncbi:hypothetical protein GTZ89_45190 [Streptomyces sp. SID8382]|nr:hypothetical protein [Streptomyces sp. SID8382]